MHVDIEIKVNITVLIISVVNDELRSNPKSRIALSVRNITTRFQEWMRASYSVDVPQCIIS